MANSIVSKKVITPVCRLAYPYVFEADDKGKYRAVLLFAKENFNTNFLSEIVNEVKSELVATKFKNGLPATFRANPLKDGDIPNSVGNTPFAGYFYCNVGSNFAPGVVASYPDPVRKKADGSPAPMVIEDPKEIYGGVYARVQIHAYSYNFQGNCGIALSMDNIQKIKDGERLGGGKSGLDDFDCPDTNEIVDNQGVVNNIDAMMGI